MRAKKLERIELIKKAIIENKNLTFNALAKKLNKDRIATTTGKAWTGTNLLAFKKRYFDNKTEVDAIRRVITESDKLTRIAKLTKEYTHLKEEIKRVEQAILAEHLN